MIQGVFCVDFDSSLIMHSVHIKSAKCNFRHHTTRSRTRLATMVVR